MPPQIFMYRVSPFTYMIGGWAGAGLAGRAVQCARTELAIFDPPSGQTCQAYLARYLQEGAGGQLYNPQATAGCEYCPLTNANQFLAMDNIVPSQRWRNFGIGWAFIIFNVFAAVLLYYMFRVRHFSIGSLAKGPARAMDMTVKGLRRMFARHSEPTPLELKHVNSKVF